MSAAAPPQTPANPPPSATPQGDAAQRGGAGGGANPANMRASGSLYVGDLQPDVTEAILFETFNQVGPVSSIRVCRDASSRISLGYAYVNFHNVGDAELALDTLNFTPIKGWPCRIMWSHRDPSARKNNNSNIFIKNLDPSVDNKSLYDTFSTYGNILSCKVALDSSMQSKGYAFVHFETEEAAQKAIEAVNGMLLGPKKVYAGKFERRQDRSGGSASKFTNLYVKFVPAEWTEAKFAEVFGKFGKVTSLRLPVDPQTNKNKGFGFVNYDTHEEALKAKEEGSKVEGAQVEGNETKFLYVDRFQKRAERASFLQRKYEDKRREKNEKYKNRNLYVKNLEEDVDKDKLAEMFQEYGEITSAVIVVDDRGVSRGFGFVCFANPDDAGKALQAMNGKIVGAKPLYVNRAQRKEERKLQLESQFQASMMGRMQPMAPVFYGPPGSMVGQPGLMYPQQMMGRRYPAQPPMRGGYPPYPQQMKRGGARGGPQGRAMGRATGGNPKFRQAQGVPGRYPRDQMPVPLQMPKPPQDLSTILANSTPEVQKQLLGERLFPLVQKENAELAGKITGMLLEMEVQDILPLTESHSELMARIEEALTVLNASPAQPAEPSA